jgi:hypothetical protein
MRLHFLWVISADISPAMQRAAKGITLTTQNIFIKMQ